MNSVARSKAPAFICLLLLLAMQVAQHLCQPHLYGALCLLVDEAGFLIEPKTAALIARLPPCEGQLVAAEAVVRSLGVTDGPAFDALVDALRADGGAEAAAQETASLTGGICLLQPLSQPSMFVYPSTLGIVSSATASVCVCGC